MGNKGDANLINSKDSKNVFNYLKDKKMCSYEFNEKTKSLHFYVNDKIFAILSNSHSVDQLTLRLPPNLNQLLREKHKYVLPSYDFMNTYHWSTFYIISFPDIALFDLIDISYNLTIEKMTKKQKFKIEFEVA